MDYFQWHRHYYCRRIKDSIYATYNLYEYTCKVITSMILTSKGCLRPDIWLKMFKEAENTQSMIRKK